MKLLLIPAIVAALFLGACSKPTDPTIAEVAKYHAREADNEAKRIAIQSDQQKFDHEIERTVIDACIAKGGVPVKNGNQAGCAPPFKQAEKTRDEAAGCLARGGNWITVGDSGRCTK